MPPAIEEATITWRDDGTAWSPVYGDIYHPAQGALQQAEQVFLRGNGLPQRWRGRSDFVVLETGFGLGNNFLATWQAWRADPERPTRLHYVAVEAHPPRPADLRRAHAASPLRELADELLQRWPPPSPDLHRVELEHAALRLALAWGDAQAWLRSLQARVDAFYLDGFAPQRNPQMWTPALFQRLGRLAAPGATAATWSAARTVRDGLAAAGFQPERAAGPPGKRDITLARYAPVFQPPQAAAWAPVRSASAAAPPSVLVIGGGLAGCAAVRSLARLGWPCTLLDAAAAPARGASANAAGLFHASFSAPDGRHAQWHRAAAAAMQAWAAPALAQGRLRGRAAGLLQLQPGLDEAAAQQQLARAGLPAAVVDWLDPHDACARTGLPGLPAGGWWFGQGGWLSPPEVAQAWLDEARNAGPVETRFSLRVHALRQTAHGWQALDANGAVLAEAGIVVLANAIDALRLLRRSAGVAMPALPFEATRGQVTQLPALAGLRPPHVPVTGAGYAIGLHDGGLLCGATRSALAEAESVPATDLRAQDHAANLRQAVALGVVDAAAADAWLGELAAGKGPLTGRCGARLSAVDRLPWVGPLPDLAAIDAARAAGARIDALRHLPRLHGPGHGLYLLAALGSRGLTSAALAGELLAHWIAQTPCPVAAPLCDALDPARHMLRLARRPRPLR